ncbi:unnamed protein product [[Candida] boidinii]|nr:unnamed protein product [[Candida] boidinii]
MDLKETLVEARSGSDVQIDRQIWEVGGQAVLGRQPPQTTPWLTERHGYDPTSKDGELCLNRVKPEETLVEARSGSDVQIDRQIWV